MDMMTKLVKTGC